MANRNPENSTEVPYAQITNTFTGNVYGHEGDKAYIVGGLVILGRSFSISETVIHPGEKGSVQFLENQPRERHVGVATRLFRFVKSYL